MRGPAWKVLPAVVVLLAIVGGRALAEAAETVNVAGLKVSADCPLARNEHPRLLFAKRDLPEIRKRIKGPMADAFAKLKKIMDTQVSGKNMVAGNAVPLAFMYSVTGERRYADAVRQARDWDTNGIAIDMIYDTLTKREIQEIPRKASASRRNPLPALAVYGSGIEDKRLAKVIADGHGYLMKRFIPELNAWAQNRGGDVNSFSYIGNHRILRLWPDIGAYSTALDKNIWPESDWSKYFAAYLVYNLRPDKFMAVHVEMESSLRDGSGGAARGFMRLFFQKLVEEHSDGLARWWAERAYGDDMNALIGKILWRTDKVPAISPDKFPPARLFPTPGYVVMRSDWSSDAVLGHFRCGAWSNFTDGRHCATNNTFQIYHKGRLVMNTGAHHGVVAGALSFKDPKDPPRHSREYAIRTLASNGLLVRDPGDPLWPRNAPNDGGQMYGGREWAKIRPIPAGPGAMGDRGEQRGTILAYETSPVYDYVCGDATLSYSPKRVERFTRQFVFLRPEIFVVFDRVKACQPSFQKMWIMHTPVKPTPNEKGAESPDKRIHADGHFLWTCDGGQMTNKQGGRLFWRMLLPEQREIRLLGGEGHEFEIEDVNRGPTKKTYVMPSGQRKIGYMNAVELAGLRGWRVEVEAKAQRNDEVFLNVLEATDATKAAMVPVEMITSQRRTGVRVTVGAKVHEVTFNTTVAAAGHIRITEGDKVILDRDLADRVTDNYKGWKDTASYKEWMTNPFMRTVIGEKEQDEYQLQNKIKGGIR